MVAEHSLIGKVLMFIRWLLDQVHVLDIGMLFRIYRTANTTDITNKETILYLKRASMPSGLVFNVDRNPSLATNGIQLEGLA